MMSPSPMKVMTAGGANAASSSSNNNNKRRKKGSNRSKMKGNRSNRYTDATSLPIMEAQNRSDEEKENGVADVADLLELEEPPLTPTTSNATTPQHDPSRDFAYPPNQKPLDNSGGGDMTPTKHHHHHPDPATNDKPTDNESSTSSQHIWLFICFLGIMMSFVCYGLLLEYATSGGRKLHELSFLFVTSGLYTLTAAAGRYVRDEEPTSIPPARFAVLGMTSMGSTFCSVRSLRFVIFPIQVLAKSCKPVPVMIMGALMGKKYPLRKYINVCMIVMGVALFMGGGDSKKKTHHEDSETHDNPDDTDDTTGGASQMVGILLLFVSLCFDGGTGAYEDKLMQVHSVGPFDLMYNIQLGKTILAGIGLLVLNQVHIFLQMCQDMGFLLIALGLSGALGQVFIFVTIAKFGALTCSIIGLARKVATLVASILLYGHPLSGIQFLGLVIAVGAMVMNFWGKKGGKGGGHHHHGGGLSQSSGAAGGTGPVKAEELQKFLDSPPGRENGDAEDDDHDDGDLELADLHPPSSSTKP